MMEAHEYTVTWSIQVTDDNPVAAAEQAWAMMHDVDSTASVLVVVRVNDPTKCIALDMNAGDQPVEV